MKNLFAPPNVLAISCRPADRPRQALWFRCVTLPQVRYAGLWPVSFIALLGRANLSVSEFAKRSL